MDACASIPTVDEPVDRFDRRLGAGTGPLGGGPPGSALRGHSIVGGQSGPRCGVGGWQSNRSVVSQRHSPDRAVGWLQALREEGGARSRNPRRPSCRHLERSSAPIEPRGLGLGRSSDFFRYRNHSSFVDGRDARLVTVRSPSEGDQRIPRHASASSAAAEPLEAQQGRMQ